LNIYQDFNEKSEKYIIATYEIETNPSLGHLNDAAWALAIGQSVGNPNQRSVWETDEIFERSSCLIFEEESRLSSLNKGEVRIGFPVVNFDFKTDGISQLMCALMGGQLDISMFLRCRLNKIEFPEQIKKMFLGPKFGINGIRSYTKNNETPILGAILKPKTGMSPQILNEMLKELIDGGAEFIKEDEILSNPIFCRLEDRLPLIVDTLSRSGRNVVYAFCINSDPHAIIDRAKFVSENGGNGIHVNFWSGLGVYNSLRKEDLNLFIHFQKSGDKILTNPSHDFGIDWDVICEIAGLTGVDTIHAGMWGGYSNDTELNLSRYLKTLRNNNVMPALSCGFHPGLADIVTEKFGLDYIANTGGAIHAHPGGTIAGTKAMKQALTKQHGPEFEQAIKKWGLVNE
jgi:ribulose 1,5-bisphosphate carboxylase large subunit-like protein